MLSISSVIDEFKSLMSQELSESVKNESGVCNKAPRSAPSMAASSVSGSSVSKDLFDSSSITSSTKSIAPLRSKKKGSKYEFENVKLYCRFPKMQQGVQACIRSVRAYAKGARTFNE